MSHDPKTPSPPSWADEIEAQMNRKGAPQFGMAQDGDTWVTRKGARAALFLLDASPVVQIREGKRRQINALREGRPVVAEGFDPFTILDYLSKPSHNTIVLTHTVLKELLRENTISHGICYDKAQLRLNLNPSECRYHGQRLFQHWLNEHSNDIRIYPTIESMIEGGEFSERKGGIVIVDDPVFGAEHHPANGIYPALEKHAGEASIVKFSEKVADLFDERGIGYAVIGSDTDLLRPINNMSLAHPGARTPKIFNLQTTLSALCAASVVDPALERSMYELLCRKADPQNTPDKLSGTNRARIESLIKYFTADPKTAQER